ncbi:MAG TPA: hypothetical protein VMM37_01170, partial [Bacteroidota bacterium]|nr:hypothetical protein [Bacteroidota bacterium]
RGAVEFARLVSQGGVFGTVTDPALDIVAYFPLGPDKRASSISQETERVFNATMNLKANPVYLAKMNVKPSLLSGYPELIWDQPMMTVLRSVFMKPEQLSYLPTLYTQILNAAR